MASPIVSVNYGGDVGSVANRYTTFDFVATDTGGKKVWASLNTAVHTSGSNINVCAYSRTLDYFMAGGD